MPCERRQSLIRKLEKIRGGRVVTYVTGDRPQGGPALDLSLQVEPTVVVPQEELKTHWEPEEALRELLRGRLEALGPATAATLAASLGVS